jgi:hypothetical protein
MLKLYLLLSFFMLPNIVIADFSKYGPLQSIFLKEELKSPHRVTVNDLVVDNCWTNIDESRAAMWRPISDLGIETARATYNYVDLKVEGLRKDGMCVGHARIHFLMESIPYATSMSGKGKPPMLGGVVAENTKVVTDSKNLNLEVLSFVNDFMADFTEFMKPD